MARSPRSDGPAEPPRWTRRRLLLGGGGLSLLAVTGLAGCSVNPSVDDPSPTPGRPASGQPTPGSSPGRSEAGPSATTPPAPGYPDQAVAEQGLADLARAVGRRTALSDDQAQLVSALVAGHTDHARVLASADPENRPTTSTAVKAPRMSIDGLSTAKALNRLADAEAKLAGSYRRRAVRASGLTALLWGSLAVAAENYVGIEADNPPTGVRPGRYLPVTLLTDVAATQQVVAQLHAIVYGYQVAIGKMSVTSDARPRALTGLRDHRRRRDELIGWLNRRKAEVPTAAAAYVTSPDPTDTKSASKLIRSMETALLPFGGLRLAAAASTADREVALTALRDTARTARRWGAGARAWPGYRD